MKIALAQINPTTGALEANCRRIIDFAGKAAREGADMVVFPELTITGYPPRDLLLDDAFVDRSIRALDALAAELADITAVVGCLTRNDTPGERPLFNSAAVLREGSITSIHHKCLLPTYDVFDEDRYFQPGGTPSPARCGPEIVGVSICEDAWNSEGFWHRRRYTEDPIEQLAKSGADVLVNLSASPYVWGKKRLRLEMLAEHTRRCGAPLVYVNQVGANDELVFDGNSAAFRSDGSPAATAGEFKEDLLVVDTADLEGGGAPEYGLDDIREGISTIYDALVLGTRDYLDKCGFKGAVVALSGGIDSTVVACIASAALGPENVLGVSLPSRFSSEGSVSDARALAENLGIGFEVIPIGGLHEQFEQALAGAFKGRAPDVTEENIQARIRGTIAMALSNKFGSLLLATGNKSEMAVGYCTLYGDMCGGLAVIGDVPKMKVYEMAEYINRNDEVIPADCITKPPSAELRPDQLDRDSLPPYDELDKVLTGYVEQGLTAEEIISAGSDERTVREIVRMVDTSEFKRRQAAPALQVTGRAFGSGRRMPIARGYD